MSRYSDSHLGHLHVWQPEVSRRQFLAGTAGAVAGVAASSLWTPALAHEDDEAVAAPRPIPGGVTVGPPTISPPPVFIHHFPFAADVVPFHDPSQIADFNGFVANCRIRGTGTGTDATGTPTRLAFQVDNGFMDGRFVGLDDNQEHEGTFGFT